MRVLSSLENNNFDWRGTQVRSWHHLDGEVPRAKGSLVRHRFVLKMTVVEEHPSPQAPGFLSMPVRTLLFGHALKRGRRQRHFCSKNDCCWRTPQPPGGAPGFVDACSDIIRRFLNSGRLQRRAADLLPERPKEQSGVARSLISSVAQLELEIATALLTPLAEDLRAAVGLLWGT